LITHFRAGFFSEFRRNVRCGAEKKCRSQSAGVRRKGLEDTPAMQSDLINIEFVSAVKGLASLLCNSTAVACSGSFAVVETLRTSDEYVDVCRMLWLILRKLGVGLAVSQPQEAFTGLVLRDLRMLLERYEETIFIGSDKEGLTFSVRDQAKEYTDQQGHTHQVWLLVLSIQICLI
jgi:hypothetical protein